MINVCPALPIQVENEENGKHTAGHQLSKLGELSRSDWEVVQSVKAQMRLIDKPFSGEAGPKGLKGQGMEMAAKGRLALNLP